MIDLIIYSFLLIFIFVLLYFLIKKTLQVKQIIAISFQLNYENDLLQKQIERIVENQKLEQSDGFLKFVSDSRDWAFQYIEEVQSALKEFDNEVAPEFEWAKTFGMVLGETTHTIVLKKISEAYDKLKLVLPENTETPNN
jgi:predicted PurR-regulated permease PerM